MYRPATFLHSWIPKYIESTVIACLVIYLTLILFGVATDFNGDPNEYLFRARHLFTSESFLNFNRFIGYPIFIKVSSLNLMNLNLTFFTQLVVFILSLIYFSRTISSNPFIRTLIYTPAFIPAIAYLPKLLFPDCMILSLLLLFCGALLRRHFFFSGIFIFLLVIFKLVFIFGVLFWVAVYLVSKFHNKKKFIYSLYFVSLFLLIPAVFIATPFPLYQTTVQNPNFQLEHEQANPFPVNESTLVICSDSHYELLKEVGAKNIVMHSSDSFYLPLGSDIATKLGCSKSDIKAIQRQLITSSVLTDPQFHVLKFINRFIRNLFSFSDAPHTSWMLYGKLELQVNTSLENIYYGKGELKDFRYHEISPPIQPSLSLLSLLNRVNLVMQDFFSKLIVGCLILALLFSLSLKKSIEGMSTILGLLLSYSFVITFFAFGYDRYLVVNYFLWFGAFGLMLNEILQRHYKNDQDKASLI